MVWLNFIDVSSTKMYGNTYFSTSKLIARVPCAYKCIFTNNRCNINTKPDWRAKNKKSSQIDNNTSKGNFYKVGSKLA